MMNSMCVDSVESCLTVRSPWVPMTSSSLRCSFPVRTHSILSSLSFISFPSLYSPSPPLPTNLQPFSSIQLLLHLLVVSSHSTHSTQSYKFSHNSLPLGFYTSNFSQLSHYFLPPTTFTPPISSSYMFFSLDFQ